MKILLLDSNHPLITEQLLAKGFLLEEDFTSSYDEVLQKINQYDGIIIRSRIPLDKNFLENAQNLKFIARVGAGMENIDLETAKNLGISLINSPIYFLLLLVYLSYFSFCFSLRTIFLSKSHIANFGILKEIQNCIHFCYRESI